MSTVTLPARRVLVSVMLSPVIVDWLPSTKSVPSPCSKMPLKGAETLSALLVSYNLVVAIELGDDVLARIEAARGRPGSSRYRSGRRRRASGIVDLVGLQQRGGLDAVRRAVDADAEGRGILAVDRVGHGEVPIGIDRQNCSIVRFVSGAVS